MLIYCTAVVEPTGTRKHVVALTRPTACGVRRPCIWRIGHSCESLVMRSKQHLLNCHCLTKIDREILVISYHEKIITQLVFVELCHGYSTVTGGQTGRSFTIEGLLERKLFVLPDFDDTIQNRAEHIAEVIPWVPFPTLIDVYGVNKRIMDPTECVQIYFSCRPCFPDIVSVHHGYGIPFKNEPITRWKKCQVPVKPFMIVACILNGLRCVLIVTFFWLSGKLHLFIHILRMPSAE